MLIALNFDESQRAQASGLVKQVAGERETDQARLVLRQDRDGNVGTSRRGGEDLHGKSMASRSRLSAPLIRESYAPTGLQLFFTVGEDECRAWTIKKGMTAQEAAGAIHSDFVDQFIPAEVVHYDHFIAQGGSFAKAKESGHWRLEGKEESCDRRRHHVDTAQLVLRPGRNRESSRYSTAHS